MALRSSLQNWVLLNPPTHRPPNNQPPTTNPPTTDPPTHRPTDSIIIFKRLGNRKIFILQNVHAAQNIISVCYLFDE